MAAADELHLGGLQTRTEADRPSAPEVVWQLRYTPKEDETIL